MVNNLNLQAPALPQAKQRIAWVDLARGIGIGLVVLGHTLRGLVSASLLPRAEWVQFLDTWIYAFHMPLFFALAGLFAGQLVRKGWAAVLHDRATGIVYPYLVWSILQTLIQVLLAGQANNPLSASALLTIPYRPVMQFWFLYALLIISLIHYAVTRARIPAWAVLTGAAVVLLGPDWGLTEFWWVIGTVKRNFFYYVLGAFAAGSLTTWTAPRPWAFGAAGLGFCLMTLGILSGGMAADGVWGGLGSAAIALTGMVASVALSMAFSGVRILGFLRGWGVASLQIYVAHTLASAGFRIVLQRALNIDNPVVHLVGGVAAGIALPLLLVRLCDTVGFHKAFSLRRSGSERPPSNGAFGAMRQSV